MDDLHGVIQARFRRLRIPRFLRVFPEDEGPAFAGPSPSLRSWQPGLDLEPRAELESPADRIDHGGTSFVSSGGPSGRTARGEEVGEIRRVLPNAADEMGLAPILKTQAEHEDAVDPRDAAAVDDLARLV
jgi:hypothetical protein